MYYVGIDWADQKHDLTILDHNGTVISNHLSIKKSQQGFEQLLDRLRELSLDPQKCKIGLETPHNLMVDFLVELGYPVYTIFPGSMKSFRKRYRSSGARDDKFDSFVIADVLRTDKACWRKVDLGSEEVREIRILVRDHHHLVQYHVALSNSLRANLKDYYPEYIQFFSNVACRNSLAFILAYPEFDSARKLTCQQLSDFFKEHNLRNQKTVNNIHQLLHQKHLMVPQSVIRAKKMKAIAYAKKLIEITQQLEGYTNRLKELVENHQDGKIFLSYPGVSVVTAARLLALFGDNRDLYTQVTELQALSGTCPVTEKSGNNFSVTYFRRACNKFYREVMQNLAFSSLKQAKWAMVYYKNHRAKGNKHSHALRCLANIHLRVLFAMWKNKTCYDENIFLAQKARHEIQNNK